jgi:N-acetylmuramoyl-L-alanine amidase
MAQTGERLLGANSVFAVGSMQTLFTVLCVMCFCLLSTCPLIAVSAQNAQGERLVQGMRVWRSQEKTRFVVDVTQRPKYKAFTLDNPPRVVLDLAGTSLKGLSDTELKGSVIQNIRTGRRAKNTLRVVLDLSEQTGLTHFVLPPNNQYGHRLVLDLRHEGVNTRATAAARPAKYTTKPVKRSYSGKPLRDLTVVIDPGHGGEDPGAIGPRGTREKHVVLGVAKALHKRLNKEVGIRAVLTRTGDYYVGLSKRREIARDRYRADLFISIHADAWTRASARGASVFVVSRKGATSTLAQFLADTANKSDRIGGVEITDDNQMLKGVLADLALEGNLEHSFRVGDSVLSSMGQVAHLHKRHIEQAGFMVLKSLDVPSILVETGFISNPGEERKLRTAQYQGKMANALAKGVVSYFRQYPPPDTLFATWYGKPTIEHRIAAGETLSEIANRYGVSLRVIRELNAIGSDRILPGQVLRVPNT